LIKALKFSNIGKLYDLIARDYQIYSPIEERGILNFQKKENFDRYSLHKYQTNHSFKKILLPEKNLDQENHRAKKIALFGLHLCDLTAISLLNQIFKQDYDFQIKYKTLLKVAVDCTPDQYCFCQLADSNHHSGFDLFIQEDASDYLVFAKSEAGAKILDQINAPIRFTGQYKPVGKPKQNSCDLNFTKKELSYWQNNCFDCSACTAVCPLCNCSDIFQKKERDGNFYRQLKEISCFSENKTKTDQQGLSVFIECKFAHGIKKFNRPLCNGCGRCIRACPAEIDIGRIVYE
jgi:formate hydrogenlyase subunit 6/NADH:ubiquinone oxidoreductase subunit I